MKYLKEEINVYVISNEQPFKNWFGILISYDTTNNKCIVENDKNENIELSMSEVYEADTNELIKNFLYQLKV
jgi:hypothetical protein